MTDTYHFAATPFLRRNNLQETVTLPWNDTIEVKTTKTSPTCDFNSVETGRTVITMNRGGLELERKHAMCPYSVEEFDDMCTVCGFEGFDPLLKLLRARYGNDVDPYTVMRETSLAPYMDLIRRFQNVGERKRGSFYLDNDSHLYRFMGGGSLRWNVQSIHGYPSQEIRDKDMYIPASWVSNGLIWIPEQFGDEIWELLADHYRRTVNMEKAHGSQFPYWLAFECWYKISKRAMVIEFLRSKGLPVQFVRA